MYWAYNDHRQLVAAVQAHPDQTYWCPRGRCASSPGKG